MKRISRSIANKDPLRARNKYYLLLNTFLFSVLGIFSFSMLLYYTNMWESLVDYSVRFVCVGTIVIFSFVLLCLGILRLNSVMNAHYPFAYHGVGRLFMFFVFVAALLFAYNYLLYIFLKIILGHTVVFGLSGDMVMMLSVVCLIELVIICLVLLNHSARFTIQLYREKENLKQAQALAEFKALQYQLNPHFLFNSLNTLLSEIEYNPNNAKIFTTRLADVYRYILQTQEKKTVPILEELDFLKAYIYLHQVRIGKGLCFSYKMPEGNLKEVLSSKRIPPLALQLLVENALKHNTTSLKKPLTIELIISSDLHFVVIENNLRPKKNVKSLGGGLNNLAERYRLLSGKQVYIEKDEKTFKVQIPILDEYEGE